MGPLPGGIRPPARLPGGARGPAGSPPEGVFTLLALEGVSCAKNPSFFQRKRGVYPKMAKKDVVVNHYVFHFQCAENPSHSDKSG